MKTLFETDKLRVEYEYENAWLIEKESGKKLVSDRFYGEPECALIDKGNRWALIGGDHLTVWLNGKAIKIEDPKWIHSLRNKGESAVEILTDPWGETPVIWEMDVATGTIRKVRDFDDYIDKEYTDDVIW